MSKRGGKRSGSGRKSFEDAHGDEPVVLVVTITKSQHTWLTDKAESEGISKAEIIRRLVDAASTD